MLLKELTWEIYFCGKITSRFFPLCISSYVGRLFVKSTSKPVEILPKLNELAGFAPDQEIELFEVCFCLLLSVVDALIVLIDVID